MIPAGVHEVVLPYEPLRRRGYRWWYATGSVRVKAYDQEEAVDALIASASPWNTWE